MKKSELLDVQMMNNDLARILKNTMDQNKRMIALKDYFSGFDTKWLITYYEYFLENGSELVSDLFKDSILSKDMLNLRHSENTMKDIIKVLGDLIDGREKRTVNRIKNNENDLEM